MRNGEVSHCGLPTDLPPQAFLQDEESHFLLALSRDKSLAIELIRNARQERPGE
jgi:hypothetical protein